MKLLPDDCVLQSRQDRGSPTTMQGSFFIAALRFAR